MFTQEGQRKNASVIVPSNISINANFFTLKNALITPKDATTLHAKCLVPGFCSVSSNHTLILKKAKYQIDNRVRARENDWNVLFPTLHPDEVPYWMDKLSVVEASTLIYALFGPESTVQQQIDQKTIDVKVREAKFVLDFNDENAEDTSFGLLNDHLECEVALNGHLSADRQCELSKIIQFFCM